MKLPFFAPFRISHYEAHCEPTETMILFFVYDTRKFNDPFVSGWDAVAHLECSWATGRNQAKREAWRMRREWEVSVL